MRHFLLGFSFWVLGLACNSAGREDSPDGQAGDSNSGGELSTGGRSQNKNTGGTDASDDGSSNGATTSGGANAGGQTSGGASSGGSPSTDGGSSNGGMAGDWGFGGEAASGGSEGSGGSNGSGGGACASGSFEDGVGAERECVPWQICEPGSYVAVLPSPFHDRACGVCGDGLFSETENAASCRYRGCEIHEVLIEPGDRTRHDECTPRSLFELHENGALPIDAWAGSAPRVLFGPSNAPTVRTYENLGFSSVALAAPPLLAPRALAGFADGRVVVASSGGPLDSGEAPLPASIRAFAANGSALWTEEWLGPKASYDEIEVAPGDTAVVALASTLFGTYLEPDFGFVECREPTGALRWRHDFESPYGARSYQLALGSDGSVYATSFEGEAYFLSKIALANGELLWNVELDWMPRALGPGPEGGVVVASVGLYGSLEVAALDGDGQELWLWTDEALLLEQVTPVEILLVQDDSILVAGQAFDPITWSDVFLLELSPAGVREELTFLRGPSTDVLKSLVRTGAGEVFAAGWTELGSSEDRTPDGFVLRIVP